MKSKWWFASPEFPQQGCSRLVGTTEAGSQDWQFREAQKLSITVEGVWVHEDLDGPLAGDNDLVVATRHRAGERPILDKIHFYKQEVPAPGWVGALFHPLVLASPDFRSDELDELTIEVLVHDEDSISDETASKIEGVIAAGTQAAAIAFPVMAPFAGLASHVASAVVGLIDRLNDHDPIVEGRIRLSASGPPAQGRDLLQPGFLVCFGEEVDASSLFLDQRRRVCREEGARLVEQRDLSYAVLRVSRTALRTPDMLIDQRAATLLSEIQRGKGDQQAHALEFVRETFQAYTALKKLARFRELSRKDQPTPDEARLLQELTADETVRALLPTLDRSA